MTRLTQTRSATERWVCIQSLTVSIFAKSAAPRGSARRWSNLDLAHQAATKDVAPIPRSWIYSHIDQTDLAFESLEAAYAERSGPLGLGVRFPIYDGIRGDPRFGDPLKRMELS